MSDKIKSEKQLVDFAPDLTDEEATKVFRIIMSIQQRYRGMTNSPANLEKMRDECLTRLAGINVLATVDPAPCLYGEPPIIEILGKVPGDASHRHGTDHELKKFEVMKAKARGEDYLGQKEPANSQVAKRRNRSAKPK